MTTIQRSYEEAGDFTLRLPTWAPFAAWWDACAAEQGADAIQNLVADCAVTPDAGALAELYEDFGFLAATLAGEIFGELGFTDSYPMVRLKEARAAHSRAVEIDRKIERGEATPAEITTERAQLTPTLIPLDLLDTAERVSRRAMFFRTPAGILAMRPPNASAAAAYTDAASAAKARKEGASFAGACRALVVACAIVPDAGALTTLIDSHPVIPYALKDALVEAAAGGKAKARP